jgi:hypothetical protein
MKRLRSPDRSSRPCRLLVILMSLAATAAAAPPGSQKPPGNRPVYIEFGKPPTGGQVMSFDHSGVFYRSSPAKVERVEWVAMEPAEAVANRRKLFDDGSAIDWMLFASFAWGHGQRAEAEAAMQRALALDPRLGARAGHALREPDFNGYRTRRPQPLPHEGRAHEVPAHERDGMVELQFAHADGQPYTFRSRIMAHDARTCGWTRPTASAGSPGRRCRPTCSSPHGSR